MDSGREEDKRAKKMTDPRRPMHQEIEDHNRIHVPRRNWCPICVQARGQGLAHRKPIEERGVAELSFDYCFPRGGL